VWAIKKGRETRNHLSKVTQGSDYNSFRPTPPRKKGMQEARDVVYHWRKRIERT